MRQSSPTSPSNLWPAGNTLWHKGNACSSTAGMQGAQQSADWPLVDACAAAAQTHVQQQHLNKKQHKSCTRRQAAHLWWMRVLLKCLSLLPQMVCAVSFSFWCR
jgi:hypothetical protein